LKGRDLVIDTGLYGLIKPSVIKQIEGGAYGPSGSTC